MELLAKYALMIFHLDEWVALLVMLIMVSAVTESAKRMFFIRWTRASKKQALYTTALVAGLLLSILAPWVVHGHIRPWFWGVTAVTLGPGSNMLHWLTLALVAWKWPGLAEKLKGKR